MGTQARLVQLNPTALMVSAAGRPVSFTEVLYWQDGSSFWTLANCRLPVEGNTVYRALQMGELRQNVCQECMRFKRSSITLDKWVPCFRTTATIRKWLHHTRSELCLFKHISQVPKTDYEKGTADNVLLDYQASNGFLNTWTLKLHFLLHIEM